MSEILGLIILASFVLCLIKGEFGFVLISAILIIGFDCIERVLKDKK